MKILYVDITSPIGHKNYNYKILNILTQICHLDALFKKGYFSEEQLNKIGVKNVYWLPEQYFPNENYKNNMYKIRYRINLYKAINIVKKMLLCKKYDLVFFSSVEIISFCLGTFDWKTRCIFVDHAIAEIEKNIIKRLFWKNLNKNIEGIVMENYIKDFLEKKVKIKNKLWLVNHPLPAIDKTSNRCNEKLLIVAPSGSNDEDFVKFLIKNHATITNCQIIIKSKRHQFNNQNLFVYKTRLKDDEYYENLNKADYILLPYTNDYNYRTSAVFFEAIALNKKCIIKTNNTLKNYCLKYPDIIIKFNENEEFLKIINNFKNYVYDERSFAKIKEDYSDQNIKHQLSCILEGK